MPVAWPRTTSRSFITLAGLKKCVPITSCGLRVKEAILFTSSVEVLVARMAPGFITSSSVRKTPSFTPISSNTASMTTSASARSWYFSVGRMRPIRSSTCAAVSFPFRAEFS